MRRLQNPFLHMADRLGGRKGKIRTLILRFWRALFYQLNYRPI